MNKKGFISKLIKNPKAAFIYQNGVCVLSYEDLAREISTECHYDCDYKVISWTPDNNISFIIEYFKLIENGITPILVDHRRLKNNESDYELEKLAQAQLEGINSYTSCASVIYTSGSTGKPKGVRLSLESILNSANASIDLYKIESHDNWALSLPLFHIGGIMIAWRSLVAASSLTIVDGAKIEDALLTNPQITICSLVQLQLARLLDNAQVLSRLSKMKGIVLGGSKVASSLIEKATSNSISLSNSFGASESCAQFLATPFTKDVELLKTCGKPMSGTVSISNSKCVLEGKSIALGYLYGEDFNQRYITNDLIKINTNGDYTILGRSDFVFQKAGENINPEIIEEKLSKYFKNIYISPLQNEKYENLIAITYCDDIPLRQAQEIIERELISFERPHLLYKIEDLKLIQVGLKINRERLKSLVNMVFCNLNEEVFISAQGNPDGDVIFISHGFMGDALELEEVTSFLAENYLLIYIDLPGHGKNYKLSSLEKFKDQLISSIKEFDKKKEKNIHFITYSMSGRLFNEILRDSELKEIKCLRNFINESGAPGFTGTAQERQRRLAHDSSLFEASDEKTFFQNWYEQSVFKGIKSAPNAQQMLKRKEKEYSKYIQYWSKVSPLLSVANQRDLRDLDELPKGISYHYLCGALDEKYKNYCDFYKTKGLIKFNSYVVEGASHNIHFMKKENYLNLLKKIFKS